MASGTNDLYSTQVYKVVVKWTNGSETTIYRRYSIFFDFVVSIWLAPLSVTTRVCTLPELPQ